MLGGGVYFRVLPTIDFSSKDGITFNRANQYGEEITSIYFEPRYVETLSSPDSSRSARLTKDGKIFITSKGLFGSKEIVIDVLQGSSTYLGFSSLDYKQPRGDSFARSAYYHGTVAFIGNDRILYPKPGLRSVITDLKTGQEQEIVGDVVDVLSSVFLVYTQDSQSSASPENQYVLYNIDEQIGTIFLPNAREGGASLIDFVLCKNELGFIQYFSNYPSSTEDNRYTYYKFNVLDSKLTKIGESAGTLNPSEEYVEQLKTCE